MPSIPSSMIKRIETPLAHNPPPDFSRVTVAELEERGLLDLSTAEKAAARAALTLERMLNRTKSPKTTAWINSRAG